MRLLLMRHANTENPNSKDDFERLLTQQGKEEAAKAANFLHEHQIDKIIVSYAKRTMQTSSIIQEKVEAAETEIVTELYKGDLELIIELLASQEDRNKHILVIGHNPLIYNVVLELAQSNSKEYEFLIETIMPTARIVVIDFSEIDNWQQIKQTKGTIIETFTPNI